MKAKFVPRLVRPEAGNPYYNTKGKGGFNPCIVGLPEDSGCNVLANCVGYAVGRFNEIGQWGKCKYFGSVNAENFIQFADGLVVGQVPKVGAVMVWQKGPTLGWEDGAGHVSIVEQVISDTEVVVSESGYGSYAFRTKNRKEETYGNWGAGEGYAFLGFIYNPAECCQEWPFQVGDKVLFVGSKCYENAFGGQETSCKSGEAKITVGYPKGKYPYHVVGLAGGSDVCGWVNASDLQAAQAQDKRIPESCDKGKAGVYRVRSSVGLKLRQGPSAADEILLVLADGEAVRSCGCHTGDWLFVVTEGGMAGFCHGSYLSREV